MPMGSLVERSARQLKSKKEPFLASPAPGADGTKTPIGVVIAVAAAKLRFVERLPRTRHLARINFFLTVTLTIVFPPADERPKDQRVQVIFSRMHS